MKKISELLILLVSLIILVYIGRIKLAAFYYNQGNDYYERGLYEESIVSFKKSLKIIPSIANTHYMLANAYMERNMQDKAIEAYKKTIQIDPRYTRAYCALSQIYRTNQMYQDAVNQLQQAESIAPSNQEIKKLLNDISFEYIADCLDKGTNSFLAQDKPKAYALLNKALEIKPDFAFTHYTLAYFYFADHNYTEAEAQLNRVIQIDSQFWPAYKLLGDIYFQKGIYKIAINKYQAALALNYNDATLHNDLGLALVQMEQYDEAIVYLQEALRLDPKNLNIRYSLASTYRDKGRFNEAISEYKKLAHFQPDYPNLYNDLGDIYRQQGKNKEALEAYYEEINYNQRRLSTNPNDTVMLNNLAYAFNGIGEYNKAKEIIEKVLALQPNYRQAYLTLSKIYENLGNFKEALAASAKAKVLSTQTHFIDRDIVRLNKELELSDDMAFFAPDTIYLKNGRKIKGRIKEEDEEKIILEVKLGNVIGNLIFYRNTIGQIVRSADERK